MNRDGYVAPLDALLVINYLNTAEANSLTAPLDINQDWFVSPLDALLVINYLNGYSARSTSSDANGESGEGESASDLPPIASAPPVFTTFSAPTATGTTETPQTTHESPVRRGIDVCVRSNDGALATEQRTTEWRRRSTVCGTTRRTWTTTCRTIRSSRRCER